MIDIVKSEHIPQIQRSEFIRFDEREIDSTFAKLFGLKAAESHSDKNKSNEIDLNEVTKLKFLKFDEVFEKKEQNLGLKGKFMMQLYNLSEKNERLCRLAEMDLMIDQELRVHSDEQYQTKKYFTSRALDGLRGKLIAGMMNRRLKRLKEIADCSIDKKHYKIDEEIE